MRSNPFARALAAAALVLLPLGAGADEAAVRAFIDPVTGELREPTADEGPTALPRKALPVTEFFVTPEGIPAMRTTHRHYATATIGADGTLTQHCADDAPAAP